MPHSSQLNDILIFLISAVAVVTVFKRLKASPVLGYLVGGVIIGPYGLSLISNIKATKSLGEFGVVFLLFTIGLELPWSRLQAMRRHVFGLGLSQVAATGVIIFCVAFIADFSLEASILIGGALALSSTAVIIQVLSERKELGARFGRITFSVLLFQDLAVIVILVLLPILAQNASKSIFTTLLTAGLKATVVLALMALLGRVVLRPIYRVVASNKNAELFTAMTLFLVLATSLITSRLGLSMELGAFLAGVMLAETEYRHQVEADIEPFRGLLLGLFFMSVGMAIDVHLLMDRFGLVMSIVLGLLTLKTAVVFGLCRLFGISNSSGLRIGLLLASGGEFAFVVSSPAVAFGLLSPQVGQYLDLSVAITMACTPFLAELGKKLSKKFEQESGMALQVAADETFDVKDHVIIAGFGSVGQTVAQVLSQHFIPYVAIDINMARVSEGRARGLPVFFGDARRSEVLRAIGAERARAAIITIDQVGASTRSVISLRRDYPNVTVYVRVRDEEHGHKLALVGAHPIVPETLEPSLQLAASALELLNVSPDEIQGTLEAFRKKHDHQQKKEVSLGTSPG